MMQNIGTNHVNWPHKIWRHFSRPGDLFHAGRFAGVGPDGVFLAGGSLSMFQGGFPNTKSYQDGTLRDSGVTIKNISFRMLSCHSPCPLQNLKIDHAMNSFSSTMMIRQI